MNITLNGKPETLAPETTLSGLLAAKKVRPQVVTVEVNGSIVAKENFDGTVIKDGDRIEMVFFIGGGATRPPAIWKLG